MDTAAFCQLTDLLPEPMFLVREDGRILCGNTAASREMKVASDDLQNLTFAEIFAEPPGKVEEYLQMCARGRQFLPGRFTLRSAPDVPLRADGGVVRPRDDEDPALVMVRLRPRREASSRFVALNEKVTALSREITERKRAQAELHAQRELYRVTLSSIGDAVIATDAEGRVTFMNPVSEAMTGWSSDEAEGRPLQEVFEIVNEYTREPAAHPVEKVLRTGKVVGLANHTVLISRDGTEFPIDDSAAPIRDSEDRTFGVIMVFHDVSHRRAAERERNDLLAQERRMRAELEQVNRTKDEFLATLSHELRTPLNAILGWVQMLGSGTLGSEESRHALEVIERNVDAQTQLINDLLDVSRIVSGKLTLDVDPIHLAPVVRHAIEAVRPAAEAKAIEIVTDLDEAARVMGDADRLQQVAWNLLNNAVKFTPRGGRVDVHLGRKDSDVRIRIRDTGVGIAPDFLPVLFHRFQQADSSTTRKHGGLGLGLALVRQLVELHGGTVEAHSEGEGRGSTFTITLPVRATVPEGGPRKEPGEDPQDPEGRPGRSEAMTGDGHRPLRGLRILVVDDEADARDLIATVLAKQGAEVTEAESAAHAASEFERVDPQVVVSDIGMPDEDGYSLIGRLKTAAKDRDRPLLSVALTAYARGSDQERAIEAGFDTHLAKPVSPAALVLAIRRLRGTVDGGTG